MNYYQAAALDFVIDSMSTADSVVSTSSDDSADSTSTESMHKDQHCEYLGEFENKIEITHKPRFKLYVSGLDWCKNGALHLTHGVPLQSNKIDLKFRVNCN